MSVGSWVDAAMDAPTTSAYAGAETSVAWTTCILLVPGARFASVGRPKREDLYSVWKGAPALYSSTETYQYYRTHPPNMASSASYITLPACLL